MICLIFQEFILLRETLDDAQKPCSPILNVSVKPKTITVPVFHDLIGDIYVQKDKI